MIVKFFFDGRHLDGLPGIEINLFSYTYSGFNKTLPTRKAASFFPDLLFPNKNIFYPLIYLNLTNKD